MNSNIPSSSIMNNNNIKPLFDPEKVFKDNASTEAYLNRLKENLKPEAPACNCGVPEEAEAKSGPYYTHLGVARTLAELRSTFEARLGVSGKAVRIEKVRYCGKEGKSKLGCPIAKYVSLDKI